MKFLALGAAACAIGLGFCLLITFTIVKLCGRLPRIGLPLENISLVNADRMALRCAQVLMIFLGVQLAAPFLAAAFGLGEQKHIFMLGMYVVLITAVLWIFRTPIGGHIFTLESIGIHSRNLGKNIAWGAGAAIANIPIVLAMAWLGQKLFASFPGAEHSTTMPAPVMPLRMARSNGSTRAVPSNE